MTMNDNVVSLPGTQPLPENPMEIKPRMSYCQHDRIIIDPHTRSVQCADIKCGAVLDPFNYLLNNAMSISRAWSSHKMVSTLAGELVERVGVLKKEEKRLRDMIKRLQEKTGAVVSPRNREL